MVKINRTRYSDVSDDGSSFFGFHSTSFFSGSDDDKEDNMPEDKVVEATTEATAADAAEADQDDNQPIKLVRQNDNANVRK